MGGASTEVRPDSTDILLEAANWEPTAIARTVRRHKLPSEASKRFERRVDANIAPMALERAARLLRDHADGSIRPGRTDVGSVTAPPTVTMPIGLPDQVAGMRYAQRRDRAAAPADRLRHRASFTGDDGKTVRGRPAADVAPGPRRAGRPGGGGAAAGGLRHHPDRAAARAARHRHDREPAPPPRGRPRAGRGRVRRGAAVPVRVADGVGHARPGARRQPAHARCRLLNPLEADRSELATTLLPGLLDAADPQRVPRHA